MIRLLTGARLQREAVYPHPREAVWVAVTDPRAIAEWLMPNTFRPEVGAEFTLRCDPMPLFEHVVTARVLELVPPSRMVWSWRVHPKREGAEPLPPMRLEWTLTEEAPSRTRLVLQLDGLRGPNYTQRFKMAWGTTLRKLLPKVVERVRHAGGGEWRFEPGGIPLEKRCYRTTTLPDEFVR